MKVCFFIGSTTGGGAEHVVCELASYLGDKGHEVRILTVSKTPHSYYISETVQVDTIDVSTAIKSRKLRVAFKMVNLLRYIRKSNSECYVVFLPDTIRAFMFFRKFVKAPIILAERNNPESYSKELQLQMLDSFGKADGLVFQTTEAEAFYMNRIVSVPTSAVIPNAIPNGLPEPYHGDREKYVVSAGRFSEQKNFPLLLKAFSDIADDFPDYKLRLYGDGTLREHYVELAEKYGIDTRLELPGFVDSLPEVIRKSSLFVMPSNYEGMPNALMEAMAVGLPCIATDCPCGGPSFLIKNGENGVLVPVGQVEPLADAIKSVLGDNVYADLLGSNASEIRHSLAESRVFALWESFIIDVVQNYGVENKQ